MAVANESIALSWPKITAFKSLSKVLKAFLSSLLIFCGGIRVILDTTSSISFVPINFFCLFFGSTFCAAPASSMTSIALSGNFLSLINLDDNSAALINAFAENLTL